MTTATQTGRPLTVSTPLGKDVLLLVACQGQEGISRLFHFQLDLLAENTRDVVFDRILSQKITVELALPGGQKRHFNGICSRIIQGERDPFFTSYQLEMVPQLWLLTRKTQSRIFQHQSVPDILKTVLDGFDVKFELQGSFHPRDYCVQYRETDFAFASRLMEEEGIYYYFKHSADRHQMIVANSPQSHAELATASKITYQEMKGGLVPDDRIFSWQKAQELRSSKVTLWDHCFELPHKHLEADKTIQESVQVGKVAHRLKVGSNGYLEKYDWPGTYAQRFDGIDKGGAERAGDLQKIYDDNKRTADIRMQQEAAGAMVLEGKSCCRQLTAGHRFTLEKHFNADGSYVLTTVEHSARNAPYRSSNGGGFEYKNRFTCIPVGLPFRPERTTPRPVVPGTQTAVVVGHGGDEIFTDKYGRVKVQFHWDRQGRNNADSSCWVRVASPWAGKQWGMVHIPRVGQEVIVAFLEGDPDQPIVVGSVYNAEMMPPYELPINKTQSGIKTRSSRDGTRDNFNEIRFEDKKGEEQLYFHAEKNHDFIIEKDEQHSVGNDRKKAIKHDETTTVGNDRTETVGSNETIQIGKERSQRVGKNETINIGENRSLTIGKEDAVKVGANKSDSIVKNLTVSVGGTHSLTVKKSQSENIGGSRTVTVTENDSLDVGKELMIVAKTQIVLKTGKASITMRQNGDIAIQGQNITLNGAKINVEAKGEVKVKGSKIKNN